MTLNIYIYVNTNINIWDKNGAKTACFDTINKFFFNLDKQILGMKEFSNIYNRLYYKFVNIDKDSDARNLNMKDNSVNLAVTSPPYANAVDYPRTHQLELYWDRSSIYL